MIAWQPNSPKPDVNVQIEALTRFLIRLPDRAEIRANLAGLHIRLGAYDEAERVLGGRSGLTDPESLTCLAQIAQHRGDVDSAQGFWRTAMQAGSADAPVQLAKLLTRQHRFEEAIALCAERLDHCPSNFDAALAYCRGLVALEKLDELGEWGAASLRSGMRNAVAPSALAYAGDERLPKILGTQSGLGISCFTNLWDSDLADGLQQELLAHSARSSFPTTNAGRGEGWRISDLLEQDIPSVAGLFDKIKLAVTQFAASLPENGNHPHLASPPTSASIESWANIFIGEGREEWHCHPAGWISGVYYLELPERETPESLAGQIEFGPLMLGTTNGNTSWPITRLRPRKDMLLLFPSYFGHRTYPTQSQDPRVSIAFDIVPNAAGEDR